MPRTVTKITAHDVRLPTSRHLDGSDAMNQAPDYPAAYAIIETGTGDGLAGHGMTFTIGRTLEDATADMGRFWRSLAGESQRRWIRPEKGAIHLAMAAVVNAVWDLWAKVEGKPLWQMLADMTPKQAVRCIDFRHITDALTPDEALAMNRPGFPGGSNL